MIGVFIIENRFGDGQVAFRFVEFPFYIVRILVEIEYAAVVNAGLPGPFVRNIPTQIQSESGDRYIGVPKLPKTELMPNEELI